MLHYITRHTLSGFLGLSLLGLINIQARAEINREDFKALTFKMNVRAATCTTALVSDVNFNRQLGSDIIASRVSQPTTLSIDCSAGGSAPRDLTLHLIPAIPHPTQGDEGYIQVAGRDDVGYRLLWGDNNVGTQGDGVPMNTSLSLKNPLKASNDILFEVKPVALNGATTLSSGNVNTTVTIKVTYS